MKTILIIALVLALMIIVAVMFYSTGKQDGYIKGKIDKDRVVARGHFTHNDKVYAVIETELDIKRTNQKINK